MTTSTHVWVVESLGDDTPTLLSVHTGKESANAAVAAYIRNYRHGGVHADYWVHRMTLDYTGLENDDCRKDWA